MYLIIFLGWLNFSLLLFNTLLIISRRIYRKFHKKNDFWNNYRIIIGLLRKFHPFVGGTLLITGFLHGYMALGSFILHTGYLLWYSVIAMFMVYLAGKFLKSMKKSWLPVHRVLMLITWGLFFTHFFFKWIF